MGVTAAGGFGIVRLYDIAARPFIEKGELERVLPRWTSGHQPGYAVIPSRRRVPAKVRAFVDFARSLVIPSSSF